MSGATLEHLAKNFNRTVHRYVSEDQKTRRDYLLDVNPAYVERDRGEGWNIIDARWVDVRNGLYIDITGLSETQPASDPGIWMCKNFHRYRIKDLYPMRESLFEGVPALIPYAYDRLLVEEYESKALVLTEFEGYDLLPSMTWKVGLLTECRHRWSPQNKLWIKNSTAVRGPPSAHAPARLQPRSSRFEMMNMWRFFE